MVNEQIKADGTLVSIDVWRDDPSKVRIFINDRNTIIIPRNYLYEMRQCIDDVLTDTVLGEECAVCNPEWEGKQPIPLCEKHDEEILRQPLTEGEVVKILQCPSCRIMGVEDVFEQKPQQESNKEEMGKGCYTDKLGQLVHDIPHTCQEPSKKPSKKISEIEKTMLDCRNTAPDVLNAIRTKAVIQYLDELHNQGNI